MKPLKIVVHCSDTPDDRDVKAAEIHAWHVGQGWHGIGYHAVVERSGFVERSWYLPNRTQRVHARAVSFCARLDSKPDATLWNRQSQRCWSLRARQREDLPEHRHGVV